MNTVRIRYAKIKPPRLQIHADGPSSERPVSEGPASEGPDSEGPDSKGPNSETADSPKQNHAIIV